MNKIVKEQNNQKKNKNERNRGTKQLNPMNSRYDILTKAKQNHLNTFTVNN
jgi:hypothetical protein